MNSQKTYRALIVDDETYARRDLKEILSDFPSIDVIGEAKNIQTAIELIEQLNPDLIFLDIQFPGETGFDLFEKTSISARVVFVTAWDAYAIRAFEVNACDYLLKPVNPDRLAMTIKRIEDNQDPVKAPKGVFKKEDSIYIQLNNKFYFLKIDTIVKISAADHFTEILTIKGIRGLSNKQLCEWRKCLPENLFVQVHRSTIINLDFVEKAERDIYHSLHIKLKSIDSPVTVSRKYLKQIKERFPSKS